MQFVQRLPEHTVFYQVFEQHFDSYVRAYEERFEPRSGPLRRVVPQSVEQFLACGRLQGGFARIRCPSCHNEHLLAFSCRTRNFCSSCQAKRAALFAEKLATEILPPGAYRHWTFSIPKAIRGLFERERRLLGLLSRTAYEAVRRSFEALFDRKDVRPGCVISIQTFGYVPSLIMFSVLSVFAFASFILKRKKYTAFPFSSLSTFIFFIASI